MPPPSPRHPQDAGEPLRLSRSVFGFCACRDRGDGAVVVILGVHLWVFRAPIPPAAAHRIEQLSTVDIALPVRLGVAEARLRIGTLRVEYLQDRNAATAIGLADELALGIGRFRCGTPA